MLVEEDTAATAAAAVAALTLELFPVEVVMMLCFLTGGGVLGNFCCCLAGPKMEVAVDHGGVVGGVDFRSGQFMTGGEKATTGDGGGSDEAKELLELSEEATESGFGGKVHRDDCCVWCEVAYVAAWAP